MSDKFPSSCLSSSLYWGFVSNQELREILGHSSERWQVVFDHGTPPTLSQNPPTPQPHGRAKLLVSQGGNKSFKRLFENAL